MIFIDYPNGCIMEISCIIDSVLKPTDFLPSGKKFNWFQTTVNESGGVGKAQRGDQQKPISKCDVLGKTRAHDCNLSIRL